MDDIISYEEALALDKAWRTSYPANGLRIYELYRPGNKSLILFGVPGSDMAPLYRYRDEGKHNCAFYHVSGPTLAEWLERLDYLDMVDTRAGLLSR